MFNLYLYVENFERKLTIVIAKLFEASLASCSECLEA